MNYMSIKSVRTNGPTLCPIVWLPYAPEYVDKYLLERHVALFCIQMPNLWPLEALDLKIQPIWDCHMGVPRF